MVEVAGASVLALMTRAPSSGGKSRLFSALGCAADPRLLASLLLDTLDGARVPGVVRVVAVEPPEDCDEVRTLVPADVGVLPQVPGDLGDRMRGVMLRLFEAGARAVVIIGSDLPDITPRPVAQAFARLAEDPGVVVLGPAGDGGYYLIGATRTPDVFQHVEWGGPRVLAQTTTEATNAQLRVQVVECVSDVDTLEALRLVRAPRTRAWMRLYEQRVGAAGPRSRARCGHENRQQT
jgi:rSAM/selenodomain-associated transferase 1